MSRRVAYTFRCPEQMRLELDSIMENRNLDRTSVIKLALYLFFKYMRRKDVKRMSLHRIVREMELLEPRQFPPFESFDDE